MLAKTFEEVRNEGPIKRGPQCTVCQLVDELAKTNEKDAEALKTEIARTTEDPKYLSAKQIELVLKQNGYTISYQTIGRCRRSHHGAS